MSEIVKRMPQPEEAPSIVERQPGLVPPEPRIQPRYFHGNLHYGWSGRVKYADIGNWVDNPRTQYLRIKFQRDTGSPPNSEHMCQMMVEEDDPIKGLLIKELADSIAANGLREPLILTKDGRLLDGNRRYAAIWWLHKTRRQLPEDARAVPVWVLEAPPQDEAEQDVLTDLNFVGDYKKEWSAYVRARVLYEQWDKGRRDGSGLTVVQLSQRFGISQSSIRLNLNAMEVVEEFLAHHNSSLEALEMVDHNFSWFDQLRRSNSKLLDEDYDFKVAIFDWLLPPEGQEGRFQQMKDFTRLTEIRNKPEAWEALEAKTGPAGLREALYIVEGERLERGRDPNGKMQRVIKDLAELAAKRDMDKLDAQTLDKFHETASVVPGAPPDAAMRIQKMTEWLDGMNAGDLRDLADNALDNLRKALATVIAMAEAIQAESSGDARQG